MVIKYNITNNNPFITHPSIQNHYIQAAGSEETHHRNIHKSHTQAKHNQKSIKGSYHQPTGCYLVNTQIQKEMMMRRHVAEGLGLPNMKQYQLTSVERLSDTYRSSWVEGKGEGRAAS
jgi:hypothetical protein